MSFWDVLTWMFDHPKATNHFKFQSVLLGGRVAEPALALCAFVPEFLLTF